MTDGAARAARILRLKLHDVRSWPDLTLEPAGASVILVGANGAGKTNILEAISFLMPGRGLRRATLEDVAREDGPGGWAVAADIEGMVGAVALGTGIAPATEEAPAMTRSCRIDRAPVGSANAFAEHLTVSWLVPQMDGLFLGPASERRRFLDRLVLAVDPEHGARVNALERALRSRNRLLEQSPHDARWLDAIESELAEIAVAVAAARHETVCRLTGAIQAGRAEGSRFPWAGLRLDGVLESAVGSEPALALEDGYRQRLAAARPRDRAAGRTLDGPHRTDLAVVHGPKGVAADRASTGEQKALLTGLVLAHARLVADMTGLAPILLLDEIAAHLDAERRAALFATLTALGVQTWMTGTDIAAFDALEADARRFRIDQGRVTSV